MADPFRIAFLGIDNPHGAAWRELFHENLRDEIEITAILPGFDDGTTSLEERLTGVPRFDTVESLIEDGSFDGAFIGLPNDEAPMAAAKLAEAGKAILMEKPCAGSADDFRPVVEAVEKSGVAFQNGFMWRYDEGAERIRDMVTDGRFGKLISLEMTMVTSDVKRRDPSHYLFDREISTGGFFSWLASHYLDLLAWVTGERATGVTARTGVFGETTTEVEDGGIAILDLEGGGVATFLGGYWIPRWAGEGHWVIRGSERWVHWTPGQKLDIHGPQPQWNAMEEVFELPADDTKGYGGARAVIAVRDWIEAAREGGRPCRNTAQSTLETLALIDRIYEASNEGRTI
jgi:predicted dehydrogenase